jgi:hypothetical protein
MKRTKEFVLPELPERSIEVAKRIQRVKAGPSKPRSRGSPPLGPFTKKAAKAMMEAGKKARFSP